MLVEISEGQTCPVKDCAGTLVIPPAENCSCHINPPCSSCVDRPLACDTCYTEFEL